MVDVSDYCDGCFSWGATLLCVDEVGDFEGEGEIGLEVLGTARILDVALERCSGRFGGVCEAVARGVPGGGGLHVGGRPCGGGG